MLLSDIDGIALGDDERVDPFQVALCGRGLVLDEGTGVAVARLGLAATGELLRQLSLPALENLQPSRGVEMAAEGELEGEGPVLVGARGRVGPEQISEEGLAGGGEAVRLAGAARPAQRRAAQAGGGGLTGDRSGGRGRSPALPRATAVAP